MKWVRKLSTQGRDAWVTNMYRIPLWKRLLICRVLKRDQWKIARAHNLVAHSMLLTADHELGEAVRDRGDRLWASIYGIPPRGEAEPLKEGER